MACSRYFAETEAEAEAEAALAMPHIFSLLVFRVRSAKVENIFHILRLLWEQQQEQQLRQLSHMELLLLLLCLWRIRYVRRCRECNKMFCAKLLSCFGTKFCSKYFCSLLLPSFGWICTFRPPPFSSTSLLSLSLSHFFPVQRIRHVADKRLRIMAVRLSSSRQQILFDLERSIIKETLYSIINTLYIHYIYSMWMQTYCWHCEQIVYYV